MFPIHNLAGKVIGFGGRIMTNDKKQAKYVNSPESEIYIKSNVLYGIDLARKDAVGKNEIYLVEGYTDVVSLHQAGIKNVVASSGTSLTDGQIAVIRRYTSNITVLYDGDAAGIKASFRGIDMIIEQGLNVKVLLFPDGEDPDSFARKNTPLYVSDYIQKEVQSFIAFKAGLLMDETGDDPIKKAGVIKELVHSISLIPDNIMRSLYIKECSRITQMDEESLIIELNKQLRNKVKSKQSVAELLHEQHIAIEEAEPTSNSAEVDDDLLVLHEREILRILVNFANMHIEMDHLDERGEKQSVTIRIGDFVLHQLNDDDILFTQSAHQQIVEIYQNRGEEPFPALSELIHHQNQEIGQIAVDLSSQRHSLSEQWKDKYEILIHTEKDHLQKTVLSAVYNIKLRKVNTLLDANNRKLLSANSDDEFHTILSEQIWLNEVKQALSKQLHFVIL
jgi:DNA primase